MNLINAVSVSFGILAFHLAGALSRGRPEHRGPRILDIETQGAPQGVDPSVLAHELSAPVSALSVLTDVLADSDQAPETQAEIVDAMKRELRFLKSLVTDVDRLSPSASGPFTVLFRPTSVLGLFTQTAQFARAVHPSANLILDCPADLTVLADAQRIQQVLRNLVGNAARYTMPGAPIELRAFRVHERVRIQVADGGPGIGPGLLPTIFQKRVRGPQRGPTPVPGDGLGLFICREIVEAHGSCLEVQSSVQRGTTFSFDLGGTDDQAFHY